MDTGNVSSGGIFILKITPSYFYFYSWSFEESMTLRSSARKQKCEKLTIHFISNAVENCIFQDCKASKGKKNIFWSRGQ
jgi:hypothetical protein